MNLTHPLIGMSLHPTKFGLSSNHCLQMSPLVTSSLSFLWNPCFFLSDSNSNNLTPASPSLPVSSFVPDPPLPVLDQLLPNPPALCQSECLTACRVSLTTMLLAEFSKISHSYKLVPLSISDHSLPLEHVLSAIADGSLEPVPETNNDPLWVDALAILTGSIGSLVLMRKSRVSSIFRSMFSSINLQFLLIDILCGANLSVNVNVTTLASSLTTRSGMLQRGMLKFSGLTSRRPRLRWLAWSPSDLFFALLPHLTGTFSSSTSRLLFCMGSCFLRKWPT